MRLSSVQQKEGKKSTKLIKHSSSYRPCPLGSDGGLSLCTMDSVLRRGQQPHIHQCSHSGPKPWVAEQVLASAYCSVHPTQGPLKNWNLKWHHHQFFFSLSWLQSEWVYDSTLTLPKCSAPRWKHRQAVLPWSSTMRLKESRAGFGYEGHFYSQYKVALVVCPTRRAYKAHKGNYRAQPGWNGIILSWNKWNIL